MLVKCQKCQKCPITTHHYIKCAQVTQIYTNLHMPHSAGGKIGVMICCTPCPAWPVQHHVRRCQGFDLQVGHRPKHVSAKYSELDPSCAGRALPLVFLQRDCMRAFGLRICNLIHAVSNLIELVFRCGTDRALFVIQRLRIRGQRVLHTKTLGCTNTYSHFVSLPLAYPV